MLDLIGNVHDLLLLAQLLIFLEKRFHILQQFTFLVSLSRENTGYGSVALNRMSRLRNYIVKFFAFHVFYPLILREC